jgi:hypothetical protein
MFVVGTAVEVGSGAAAGAPQASRNSAVNAAPMSRIDFPPQGNDGA